MDRFRLISFSSGGRPIVVRDLNDGTTISLVRDTLKFSAPSAQTIFAKSGVRHGGGTAVSQTHDNAGCEFELYVNNTTADASLSLFDAIAADLDEIHNKRYLEWRPEGSTVSMYLQLRGPSTLENLYRWIEFQGTKTLHGKFTCVVAPLAEGDRMDIWDDFAVNSIADYTFDAGSGTLSVSGGQLVPSSTALKNLYHSARGYTYSDVQATLKIVTGSSVAGSTLAGLVIRRLDSNNHILGTVVFNGASSIIEIDKLDGGSYTALTSSGSFTTAASTPYWLRLRGVGNVLTLEWFTSAPTPMDTPAQTVTTTLTAGNATKFGQGIVGQAGIRTNLIPTDFRYDDFVVEPFVYGSLALPEYIKLGGSIPGNAPALADVSVQHSGSVVPFALIGWSERPSTHNLVWNGDFEETGTDGWATSATFYVNAATSINRVTTQKKFGTASAEVVTTSTNLSGVHFKSYRRFKKGVTYTASMWVRGTTTGENVQMGFGVSGDDEETAQTALTSSFQQLTVTWVPAADREEVFISIRINDASPVATTFQVDGVQVYEGTTAPALGRHAEGAGGVPPFGILEAESADTGDLTGWALGADVTVRGGFRLIDSSVSGAESYAATWMIDPATMVPDSFGQGDLQIEVWGRAFISSTVISPKIIISARNSAGTGVGYARYTEYGTTGKTPTVGNGWRFQRLGTLNLFVDSERPTVWKLVFSGSTAAGSTGTFALDYLLLVPARQRSASPTGKANDTAYPRFINTTASVIRRIRSDLSGAAGSKTTELFPDHGLGGSQIILPNGPVDAVVKLSSLVPDDPTLDSTTETLNETTTVQFHVIPRYHLTRGV